jgi:NAD(P)-dependent dehydrogenase (short-subunit alcohol dehydrogenase family)
VVRAGIGRALVDQFLSQGDFVCVTSRTSDAVNAVVRLACNSTLPDKRVGTTNTQHDAHLATGAALSLSRSLSVAQVEELSRTHADRVVGTVCDVRSPEGVEELAAFAREAMGGVDIWINNAGSNGYSYAPLVDTDPELLKVFGAPSGEPTGAMGTTRCVHSFGLGVTPGWMLRARVRRKSWTPTCWARCCAHARPSRSWRSKKLAATSSTWKYGRPASTHQPPGGVVRVTAG